MYNEGLQMPAVNYYAKKKKKVGRYVLDSLWPGELCIAGFTPRK